MKKLVALLLFIFLLFGLYIVISRRPNNYVSNYVIDSYNVSEKFDKDKNVYTFTFQVDGEEYLFNLKEDYYPKKKLITSVTKNDNCLVVTSLLLDEYAICKDQDAYYSFFYADKPNNKKIDNFEKVDIYDLSNHTYFIWNYNHLIALKKDNYSKINLFNTDVYNLNLYYQLDKYLILPNYDEKYTFSSIYLVNSNNFKTSKVYLNIDLYYDSYFMGNYEDDVYIYDMKKETEYRINPFKKNIYKNKYEYYDGHKWLNTTKKELNEGKVFFNQTKDFYFDLKDNKLVYVTPSYTINVSNLKVDLLVNTNDKEAFFISDNVLYYVNLYNGIKKVLGYKEWNYNIGNIFAF